MDLTDRKIHSIVLDPTSGSVVEFTAEYTRFRILGDVGEWRSLNDMDWPLMLLRPPDFLEFLTTVVWVTFHDNDGEEWRGQDPDEDDERAAVHVIRTSNLSAVRIVYEDETQD